MVAFRHKKSKYAGTVPQAIITAVAVLLSVVSFGWNTECELETDASLAIASSERLLDSEFTNKLSIAIASSNKMLKVDAELVQSIVCFQQFQDTADGRFVDFEVASLCNAVNLTSAMTNAWQFWTARMLLACAYAADNNFKDSYRVCTNCIAKIQNAGKGLESNKLSMAILSYYEMPDIDVATAFKVLAGSAAACMGQGSSAIKYSNQVPAKYKAIILEILESKMRE